jgi:hypothetical protein
VAEKLKSEGRAEIFRDETMEELEDDEGNVYNRKVAFMFVPPFLDLYTDSSFWYLIGDLIWMVRV